MKLLMIFITMTVLSVSMSVQAQKAGQTSQQFTGLVEAVKSLELKTNNTGKGALAGAAIGSLRKSNNRTRSVIVGAAAGAAVGSATNKSQAGMEYTIRTGPTSSVSVVSDQVEIRKGDCVSVKQSGGKGVITRVDTKKCDAILAAATAPKSTESDICTKAKNEFASASSKEALDLAKQKMEVLCK